MEGTDAPSPPGSQIKHPGWKQMALCNSHDSLQGKTSSSEQGLFLRGVEGAGLGKSDFHWRSHFHVKFWVYLRSALISGSPHQGSLHHLPSRGQPGEQVRKHIRKPRMARPSIEPGSSNTERNPFPLNPDSLPVFAATCRRGGFVDWKPSS